MKNTKSQTGLSNLELTDSILLKGLEISPALDASLSSHKAAMKELQEFVQDIGRKHADAINMIGFKEAQKALDSINKSFSGIDLSNINRPFGSLTTLPNIPKVFFDYPEIQKITQAISTFASFDSKLIQRLKDAETPEVELADKLIHKSQCQVTMAVDFIEVKGSSDEGDIIEVCSIPWFEIYNELLKNPLFLFEFTKYPRKFEEFIAATYSKQGFRVILTPRSNDKGRDVIAERDDFGAIRIIEQCKAYSPHRKVTRAEVSDLLGVLDLSEKNASKAILTTTSQFAPKIFDNEELIKKMPSRIELRSGNDLLKILKQVALKYS